MNISICIFFFICSNFLHHIYGVGDRKGKAKLTEYYDPPSKISPGESSPEEMFDPAEFDSEEEPEDTFHFSLTELSVLIRVLKTVSIENVKDLNDLSSFIRNKTENVLEGIYERFNNDFGQKFFNNLEGVIIYHSENYETDVEQPRINERFILQKLLTLRLETTIEKYAEFLNNMGIMPIPDNTTFDELKQDENRLKAFVYNDEGIKYMMRHLNREELEKLYKNCKDNINIGKKVYNFWHLFLFVRMLIRNFIQFHNRNNHYNVELNKRAIETGEFEEVSIRSYLENYDIFEVKANKFRQIFNQMYPNKKLFSLKLAESKSGIILYTKFLPDTLIEVHPIMKDFWPIIYTNFTAELGYWSGQECLNIYTSTLDPNTKQPLPFYLFFYRLDELSKNMLDHLVLNELAGQIVMTKKYIKEDTVELIHDDPAMPPHLHGNLTNEVYDKCHSRFQEIVQAHQPRHRPGGRRGRRTGRNRGGNGGGRE